MASKRREAASRGLHCGVVQVFFVDRFDQPTGAQTLERFQDGFVFRVSRFGGVFI